MSLIIDDRTKATVKAMKKRRDKTFISRMVKTLTKLETKYLTPRHNSKKQLSTKKHKNRPINRKELASTYNPALPYQELCPSHSSSPDHEIFVDYNYGTDLFQSLAENLVECSNIFKPDLSSDSSGLQSENESTNKPKYSGDEPNTTLSSTPLGQRSPRVIGNY